MKKTTTKSKSRFLRVACPRCKTQNIIYGKASTKVRCSSCKYLLAKNTGGKTKIKAFIEAILGR